MMTKEDFIKNLPAFPHEHRPGMTLRDYFAAKVMQAVMTKNGFFDDELKMARWCYQTADRMLEARSES